MPNKPSALQRLGLRTVFLVGVALVSSTSAVLAQVPVKVPPPRGMLSDFAAVVGPADAADIERLVGLVRARSGGEIAVVTLADLAGNDVGRTGMQIGQEWGVGRAGDPSDPRTNAGVVLLLVPKETSGDGRGHITIQVGTGAVRFVPDSVAGRIRLEAVPLLQAKAYGPALALMTRRLAERYAEAFGFALSER